MTAQNNDRLLRISDVEEITGLKRRMIYRLIANDRFPKQFKPGGWSSRWSEAELLGWVAKQRIVN